MKKLLLLLLLLCVSAPALAESPAERLAQLDFIVQADERIQDEEFYYYNAPFWVAGCLPASATNGMLAVLGTPDMDTHRLLKQFLSGLCHEEHSPAADLLYLYYTTKSPRSAAYEMQALVAPVTRFYSYDSVKAIGDRAVLLGKSSSDSHPLSFVRMTLSQRWQWIAETAAYLSDSGHPDARIALCGVSVGTDETLAPLRCGYYGHYVAFYLEAGEFAETGTFYMMDSYPRALADEKTGAGTPFEVAYPFSTEPSQAMNRYYSATRITDTVVQLTLQENWLTALQALPFASAERAAVLRECCENVTTFGEAWLVLFIP